MSNNQPSNTLAIIGLVLGIIAILFSFVPCLGTLAFLPGLAGLILGVISFLKAKDNGHPQGMSIAVIVVSIIACAISAFQMYALGNLASDMQGDVKEYTSCEELKVDYEKIQKEMATLTEEMEGDSPSFSGISKITKLGFKLGNIQKASEKLGCDIDMQDFDPTKIDKGDGESESESVGEGEDETKSEAESVEEEQGN